MAPASLLEGVTAILIGLVLPVTHVLKDGLISIATRLFALMAALMGLVLMLH